MIFLFGDPFANGQGYAWWALGGLFLGWLLDRTLACWRNR